MVTSLSPRQAQDLIASTNIDIVDVREPGEWSTGHLPGARLVPLGVAKSLRKDAKRQAKAAGLKTPALRKARQETPA